MKAKILVCHVQPLVWALPLRLGPTSANPPLRRLWISLGPGLLFAESKNHKDFQLAKARYLNQFAAADAVLASAGAVERKRAMDRSLVDPFGLRDLLGVVRVKHDYQVEVAVADMAWCRFPVRVQRRVQYSLGARAH
jgi:hypothetical protein